jgi:DNA repair exonuclease SbcCD ATPase subunit/DNA repair exonuclease SbcCD nuclease subunit
VKFLAFSDLHLHNPGNFGVDLTTGLSKRLLEQQKVTTQIVNIAVEEEVDAVLFIGDLVHSVGSVSTEVLNTAHLFFNSLRSKSIPVYFVPGNHDLNNRKNPKWYNYSCKVFEPSQPPKNIKLIGFHEKVDYEEVRGYDIVAIHQTPINARVGNYVFKEGFNWEELARNNKLVLCGHIHQRQHLADNCIIVGSPMQLTFGDAGDRGIYIVDSDSGAAEFRKLQYPEFITVENYWDTKDDGNYYRVLNKDSRPPDSITTENIRVQSTPEYLEERIKSTNFFEILKEWLTIKEKPESYLESLSDIVDEKFQLGKKIYNGRLRQVTIKDFLSIGDITYRVEDGFTLVLGENDVFDSNGSGKSSLFEAIYWCLFGKTTKGLSGDDVIRNRPEQQKDCKVMLSLIAADGSELNISRSREEGIGIFRKAPDAIVFYDVCGDRKLTDCQKLLESLLGIDENLFRTSCYFSQENLLMLTGLEDAARTEMITDLLGFESYNDLYSKVHKKIETVEKKVLDFNSKINASELQIAGYKGKLDVYTESLETLRETYQRTQKNMQETELTAEKIKAELETFKVTETPFRDFESEEGVLLGKKLKHALKVTNFTTTLNEDLESMHEVETEQKVAMSKAENANELFLKLVDEIGIVEDAVVGVNCRECGSVVSEDVKKLYILSKEAELAEVREKRDIHDKKVNELNKVVISFKKIREERNKTKEEYEKEGLKIEKEITDLNKERRSYETKKQEQASQKVQLQSKIQTYVDRINEYTLQLDNTASQIQTTKADIEKLRERLQECESFILVTQEEIKKLNLQVEILEFWKVAFSPKGIRALLLDKFCNEFSTILNNYLSEISNESMRLIMTPTSMTKGGEERNKIGIVVKFKEFDVSYNSLSGGEKRRVDCSLIFALSKYLEEKYELGPQGLLGIMVLDELFSSLDIEGIDSLVSLLERESKEKSIFVIDHNPRLTAFANRIFTVKKENNISSLEIDLDI